MPVLILPSTFPLSVTVGPASMGTVKMTPPATTCGTNCTVTYQRGTVVTLTAIGNAGYAFSGWSGACSGTAGTCIVTVDDASEVSAAFVVATRDLVVSALTDPPALLAPGAAFSVTVSTTNQGSVSAGASTTRFYLSQDSLKDPADLLITSTLSVPALAPAATTTGSLSLTLPATTPLGPYRLLACADDKALIIESSETNNCLASVAVVDVQRPDLVGDGAHESPSNVAPGGSFTVTDTVENLGKINAGSSITRYYLSADAVKSAEDVLFAATRSVPALAAGATSSAAKTIVVPAATPLGTYTLIACADDLKAIIELDDNNNCLAANNTIQVGRPDLVETSLIVPAVAVVPGASFSVTDTVENRGNAPAGTSTTRYYLSPNGQSNQGVLLAATRSIAVLPAGATSTGSKTVAVPVTITVGTYYLVACADDLNVVIETADGNNCVASTGTVLIGWPDLVVTTVGTPPTEIAPGKMFSMTDTVQNQGTVNAAASSTVRFYLSIDLVRDGTDVLLTGSRSVASLPAGVSSSGTVSLTVPASTVPSTYQVIACADDLLKVAEGPNESNNCTPSGGAVNVRLPDLVESTITNPPITLTPGATFAVTETVTNLGAIGASATSTRYYLSTDGVSPGSVLLTGVRSVGTLSAGSSSTGTRSVTVPTTVSTGNYYLVACADDTKVVIESSETNNCLASAVTTTIR